MADKTKLSVKELRHKAYVLREDVIKMLEHAGSGHSAGPLGLAEIFAALYFDIMKLDPKNPEWDERDYFFLSNGHCVPIRCMYLKMMKFGISETCGGIIKVASSSANSRLRPLNLTTANTKAAIAQVRI